MAISTVCRPSTPNFSRAERTRSSIPPASKPTWTIRKRPSTPSLRRKKRNNNNLGMVNQEAVTQFRGQLRGELIQPGDPGYENARKVYNGMIDKKPRLIAKCVDAADVIASVKFGRASG